jgi:hypothetical protein
LLRPRQTRRVEELRRQHVLRGDSVLGRESVIDEATSAVDTATELAIQRGLARLTEGRTTNVCVQELERHVENTRETAPEGSRPYGLHFGSRAALDALEDCETPLTRVTSVPRPHRTPARNRSDRT